MGTNIFFDIKDVDCKILNDIIDENIQHHTNELFKLDSQQLQEKLQQQFSYPVVSLNQLNTDLHQLSNRWNVLEQVPVPCIVHGTIKERVAFIIKKILRKCFFWMILPSLERQNEINIRTYRVLDSISQMVKYQYRIQNKEQSVVWLCFGNVVPSNCYTEILLEFFYYHNYINSNSQLLIVSFGEIDIEYHNLILQQIDEIEINDVQILLNPDETALVDYCNMASVIILAGDENHSTNKKIMVEDLNAPIITKNINEYKAIGKRAVLILENQIKRTAELINLLISDIALRDNMLIK